MYSFHHTYEHTRAQFSHTCAVNRHANGVDYLGVEEVVLRAPRCRRCRGHGGPEEVLQAGNRTQEEVVCRELREQKRNEIVPTFLARLFEGVTLHSS